MPVIISKNLFKLVNETVSTKKEISVQAGIIKHVIWNGATTTGHLAQLVDKNNNILWEGNLTNVVTTSGGANSRMADLNINIPFDGIYCTDLDSGSLLIYFDFLK